MKNALFLLVSHLNSIIIETIESFSEMLLAIVLSGSSMAMKIIDPERMAHAAETVDQVNTITELKILQDISAVRDDALKCKEWNEQHEEHLEFLGNLLYNEHDWDEEQIEEYIAGIVATGPPISITG